METAFILLIIVIIFFVTRRYFQYLKFVKRLERYPTPPGIPFVGNALDFKSPTLIIPKLTEYADRYGNIIALYFGLSPKLFVFDYKFLEHILSSNTILHKGEEYLHYNGWLGKGLLTSDGDSRWKSHRKLLLPSFHVQIFKEFLEVYESNAQLLVRKLQSELGKSSFDICPYITLCALDIICEATLGTSIHAQENVESEYVKNVKMLCELLLMKIFNPLLQNKFLYRFTNTYAKEKKALKVLHDYANSVIENRQQKFFKKSVERDVNDEDGRKKKLTLLDLLLQNKDDVPTLSATALREEVDTFMFAGYDTTASALSFALHCLAENPDVQIRVVEELCEIFADDKTRPVTLHDIQEMKYLEAVIKEVLRLYPPVPYYSRVVNEEFEYDGGIIPKGLSLIIYAYGVHHNAEYFPEPEKFLPERFINDNGKNNLPYSYIPFSAGPRNCIGQKFAMLELKSVLSILLRKYEFLQTNPKHELLLSTETVLISKTGIRLRIKDRKL